MAAGGSQTLLHQFFQFSEGITHFFPFREQFIQNLPIGPFEVLCNSTTSSGVDPACQFGKSFLVAGLGIHVPVHISQAPEKVEYPRSFAICRFVLLYFP